MNFSISNSSLEISVLTSGAEISSIKSVKSGKEYMWNADPAVWGSYAPVLFPIIGALKNNECTIDGQTYKMPKHGFIRNNSAITLKSKSSDEIVFELAYSDDSLLMFPYKFNFSIGFKLDANTITVSHTVVNQDSKDIHFGLGAHPGFKCPINEGEEYSDYYLEFEEVEHSNMTLLSADGLVSDKSEPLLTNSNILPLDDAMFNNDALIVKDLKSRKVSLKSHKSPQVVTVAYKDFPYLGLWAKPQAPFICIEPWIGTADNENTDGDFLKKDKLISLPQGETFTAEYTITIDE